MEDNELFKRLAAATLEELMQVILVDPSYLTDPYYRDFGEAIRKRAVELVGENVPTWWG